MDHSIATIRDRSSSNYGVPLAIKWLLKRFHRSLKASLMARLMNNSNWLEELSWVRLSLRTSPKEDLSASSAELVYGEALTLPGEL